MLLDESHIRSVSASLKFQKINCLAHYQIRQDAQVTSSYLSKNGRIKRFPSKNFADKSECRKPGGSYMTPHAQMEPHHPKITTDFGEE